MVFWWIKTSHEAHREDCTNSLRDAKLNSLK